MADDSVVTDLWQELVAKLNSDDRLTPQLQGFMSLVEPKGILGETLYLEVPNELTREMIQTRMRTYIQEAMAESGENGGPNNFAVVVNPDIESAFEPAEPLEETLATVTPIGTPVSYQEFRPGRGSSNNNFDTRLNPKYTFDSFVTGGSNRFAHAAAFAVSE
ncbi:MAG: chromosomal replication initiator protein DnaA, partial [Actinobacteria bacterium]|nr:chromosomal replication initiator protein DnaA [Actinomycetota bacterium]